VKRSTVAITMLSALLVASNVWWFVSSIDCGVTAAYREDALHNNEVALKQLLAIVPIASSIKSDPSAVIAAAKAAVPCGEQRNENGTTVVGRLGLRFGSDGRVIEVDRRFQTFQKCV